jgi:rhodanese-related sulfurtransferase
MKTFEFSPRLLTTALILMLGLIIAAVPRNTTTPFKLTAEQILDEIKSGTQYLEPEQIAQMIVEKEPTLQLIDVRPVTEFEKFSLPGAINIPIDNILAAEFVDVLNQDIMTNVFYSNGTTQANEAWMLVRQLGYENNYVLRGGLNYWAEAILNPERPASTSPDDELARYDFRMGASQALGGGGLAPSESKPATTTPIPKPKPQGKKKAVAGGCS